MSVLLTAADVTAGDTLPDLDNAYVFEAGERARDEVCWQGHSGALDSGLVLIGFHDALGNENYLMLQDNHPLNVIQGEAI